MIHRAPRVFLGTTTTDGSTISLIPQIAISEHVVAYVGGVQLPALMQRTQRRGTPWFPMI